MDVSEQGVDCGGLRAQQNSRLVSVPSLDDYEPSIGQGLANDYANGLLILSDHYHMHVIGRGDWFAHRSARIEPGSSFPCRRWNDPLVTRSTAKNRRRISISGRRLVETGAKTAATSNWSQPRPPEAK